jgi:hypothetical protein
MKRIFFCIVFFSTFVNSMLCNWLSMPFQKAKQHFENHGAGKLSLEQLRVQNELLAAQAEALAGDRALTESMEKISEAAQSLANTTDATIQQQKQQTEHMGKISNSLGSMSTWCQIVGIISAVVQIARFSKDLVQGTKNYFRPSYEQQLQNATFEMHKCLVDFQDQQRDNLGMPVACHKQLTKFESLAGCERKQSVVNAYNKMH